MEKLFIIGHYKNGNYDVTMLQDGTKIRQTEEDEFIPAFPENADVKITDKCSQGCPFCYEGCTKEGNHSALMNGTEFAQPWMNTLHPYTELAINGNDLDHPQLDAFLLKMQEMNVFVNVTVNQNQFMKHLDYLKYLTNKKMIWGLGVSLVKATPELFEALKNFPNAVIHTIAGLLTEPTIQLLMENKVKVLVLGYKNLGRGIEYKKKFNDDLSYGFYILKNILPEMVKRCKVVSFDNLAIEQLGVKELLFKDKQKEWDEFYMGDDGNFTLYIDAVSQKFSKNSCMPADERFPIEGRSMTEMFNFIRDKYGIKH
jgi:hypothetical protein